MNKIILALDTTNLEEAIAITKKIKSKIFTIKLGLELWNAHGKGGVKKFNEIGITNLMLDIKMKDVGTTVYKAIKALDDINFGFLTIHGQGGKVMIDEAKIVREIIGNDLLIFTPGIRLENETKNDQKRVCTPIESIKNGADKIIM